MAPQPTREQSERIHRLVGLPYVCLEQPQESRGRIVGQLKNGDMVRAEQIEDIFNAALVIEALEGQGSAASEHVVAGSQASTLHKELVRMSERLFGTRIQDALPIYLSMPKTTYGTWEDRPRVQWPKPQVS